MATRTPDVQDPARGDEFAAPPSPSASDMPPQPDEPGPHDVPDDLVIDKTLPASVERGERRPRDER